MRPCLFTPVVLCLLCSGHSRVHFTETAAERLVAFGDSNEDHKTDTELSPGTHLVIVPISGFECFAPFCRPERRMDLIVSWNENGDRTSDYVASNVFVVGVHSEPWNEQKATLAVTTVQAELIRNAQAKGRLWLAVRSFSDGPVKLTFEKLVGSSDGGSPDQQEPDCLTGPPMR